MKNSRVVNVEIGSIREATFNPPNRIGQNALWDLKRSIKEIGLIYPLLVTEKLDLIDGHRRLECLRSLGATHVPVIVVPGDQASIFAAVNSTARRLTAADDLYVSLTGGKTSKRIASHVTAIKRVMGDEFINHLAEERVSPVSLAAITSMILRYIGRDTPPWRNADNPFASTVMAWVVENKMSFGARVAIANSIPKDELYACIIANVPLTRKATGVK